jgi:hypothetical protein
MMKSCGCPYGCCSCGEDDDNKTDVFYIPEKNELFFLVQAASSTGPVGWEAFDGYIYVGQLGDNYLEHVGRMAIHAEELAEFEERNADYLSRHRRRFK